VTEQPAYASDIRLERRPGTRELSDELARTLERVGLRGVLDDLNRTAQRVSVPALAAVEGFAWQPDDRRSLEWYPQGITTSADAGTSGAGDVDSRQVIVTSWYAKPRRRRPSKGVRLTFVDYTDRTRPRYRHVLLVEPFRDAAGEVDYRPVRVHAGGIVWYGRYLYVAGTRQGLRVFEIDDLTAVPAHRHARRSIGRRGDGGYAAFGYRYILPQSFAYSAWSATGLEPMRYSFLSLDRAAHQLVAGEYGRDGASTRLVHFALDPATSLLSTRDDGHCWPLELLSARVERMQGAAYVDGSYAITCSQGRTSRGDLWTGRPGRLTRHKGVLAIGPEDIAYWPSRRQLWTLTEWPTRRWVYAIDSRRWILD
jgi:hypothetical protein